MCKINGSNVLELETGGTQNSFTTIFSGPKIQLLKFYPDTNLGSKQFFFNGLFPLAYLSPQVFKPDKTVPSSLGLLDRGKPIIIRLIDYNASHDWNYRDYREDFLKIISRF